MTEFSLADDTLGDLFDVQVFMDPVFATPVFKTVSGISACPHEPHTVTREDMRWRHVQSDFAPADFDITGFKQDGKSLSVTIRDVRGDTLHFLETLVLTGASQAYSYTLMVPFGTTRDATITIDGGEAANGVGLTGLQGSGPQQMYINVDRGQYYNYPNLVLSVASACESGTEGASYLDSDWITSFDFYYDYAGSDIPEVKAIADDMEAAAKHRGEDMETHWRRDMGRPEPGRHLPEALRGPGVGGRACGCGGGAGADRGGQGRAPPGGAGAAGAQQRREGAAVGLRRRHRGGPGHVERAGEGRRRGARHQLPLRL